MKTNYNETMDNCRNYIFSSSNIKTGFFNLEGSNARGYECIMHNGMSVKIRVDKSIDFLIYEVFPGITVKSPYLPMVAECCQRFSTDTVYLVVDPDQGSVYTHCECSIQDSPVTEQILKKMETIALQVLDKHVPVLECLAYGRLPDCNHLQKLIAYESNPELFVDTSNQMPLDATLEVIQSHLLNSGHNVVGRNLDYGPTAFFLETMTEHNRFRENVILQPDGWLIFKVRLEISCKDVFRTQIAQICNIKSANKKVGYLRIEDGYPVCTVSTFMNNKDTISKETLENMGNIARIFLISVERELLYLCNGILPPKDTDLNFMTFRDAMKSKLPTMMHPFLSGISAEDDDMEWKEV